ncbi:type I restriction endonuclease [Clostridium fessum]|uniref:type I restriction endonuclease n=1 Tax=Clostridium fessum TaxID=2126740 RepID=UPI0022E1CFFA|nr:type I restriction endonuclease [Clostridium fessum]
MQKDRLLKLVEAYQEHFKQYNRPDYNETEVRNDFVNPFFEILGWDVQNKKNLPQHLREVKHEASVFVEENGKQVKKKPDYEFHVGSTPYFFLETKKPNVDIMTSKEAAFQTRRYGWNGNLEISVLSNFTDLVIYDTSVRPNENDKPSVAQIAHFHFTEYVDKFDEISRLLSYETVVSGAFERTFANISSSLKKEPFDKYFLSQIKVWRLVLSEDIFENNPTINQETLNIFVQKLINRIVFLRICEDRELEKYESLKNIGTYVELKKVFAAADKKYDSGLFELIDGEQFEISDSVLVDIFKELYYPNSCYEFSIVDPFIIGQIYELFLEEEIVIKEKTVVAERKPEIVDSQGVVNTPKNVADIIVKTTLNPLFTNEKFTEWGNYRIVDICCGSGNFLLAAYEFIINRYVEYYMKNDLETAIQRGILIRDTANNFKLSYEQKRTILQKNIWGVDIDILAVEVAKFSLLIKLIEESSLYEMECFVKNNGCRILPSLDNNIKNGNIELLDDRNGSKE